MSEARAAKIQYVVRDFYTDIWKPFDTRKEAEEWRDRVNAGTDPGPDGEPYVSITVYDAANDRVISHD